MSKLRLTFVNQQVFKQTHLKNHNVQWPYHVIPCVMIVIIVIVYHFFVQMDHDYRFDLIRFSCFFMMISDDCLNNKFEAQKRKFRLLLAVLFCLFRLSVCCWA